MPKSKETEMPVQVSVNDSVSRGRSHQTLTKAVKEGLLIRDYLNAEISLGELAELLGVEYADAREWLHRQGVATARKFRDPELERVEKANFRKLREKILPQ